MNVPYTIYYTPPADFQPVMEAAGCYCTCEEKILLVKRQPFKTQGNKWGVPAGKLEKNEEPQTAIIRELKEEVGLTVTTDAIQHIKTLFIRLPPIDYIYHMFFTFFHIQPAIVLDLSENQEAMWASLPLALQLPLMAAGKESLLHYHAYLERCSQTLLTETSK